MTSRWVSSTIGPALLGATVGACAGGLIAAALVELNDVRISGRGSFALFAWFAGIYGTAGFAVGAACGVVRVLVLCILRREARPSTRSKRSPMTRGLVLVLPVVCVCVAFVAWRGGSTSNVTSPAIAPIAPGTPRLLLIGIDGLDWKIAQRLMAAGELPNLARMKERGFGAPLATIEPTLSPLIWNSIASGVEHERHGVHGFDAHRVRGGDASFSRLVPNVGMWRVFELMRRFGLAERVPVGAEACRVPRLWDVIGAGGRRVFVANWWATWPAEPANGWIVTDRFYYFGSRESANAGAVPEHGTVHPPEVLAELAPLRVAPSDVPRDELRRYVESDDATNGPIDHDAGTTPLIRTELRFLLSMDETYRRVVSRILAHDPPPEFSAVYLRGLDVLSHAALRYSDLGGEPSRASAADVAMYGHAVRRYYATTDAILGEWIALAGPDTTVLVVSDHGFERTSNGEWGHDHAPDGVIFGAGGLVRQGAEVQGATIYDLAPTVLYLAGAPIAEDQPGRVLSSIVEPDHLRLRPVRSVATFGERIAPAGARMEAQDEEQLRRLRAIGYIK